MEQESMKQQPLHQILQNSNLNLLEAALPYVPEKLRRPLAVYIKFSEVTEVMNGFENEEVLEACGLNDQNMNYELMLQAMKMSASKEQSEKLEQMMRIMNLGKMLPSMLEQVNSPKSSSNTPLQENSAQSMDMMKTLANFMQMNQQPQSSQHSSAIHALLNDPRTSSIPPEKLQLIQGFIANHQKKSPDELLPQIMQLSNQMQSQGLSFNKQEMELLLDILKESMTPEERNQVDMVLQMLR